MSAADELSFIFDNVLTVDKESVLYWQKNQQIWAKQECYDSHSAIVSQQIL